MPDSTTTPPPRPSTNAPQDAGKKTAPSGGKTTKRAAASPATTSTATKSTATKSTGTKSTSPKPPKPPKAEPETEAVVPEPVTAPDPAPELVTPPAVDPLSARLDLLVQEGGPRLSKSAMKVVQRRMAASEAAAKAAAAPVATPVDSLPETAPAPAEAGTTPSALALRSAAALRAQFERIREQSGALYTRLRPGSAVVAAVPQTATTVLEMPPADDLETLYAPAFEPEREPLAALDAREISAWFGDHQVLDRVSLTMPAGVITSLIGPSGCGKSTFLRILNRMHELIPSASLAGEVLLDGEDIYDAERRLVDARKSIGMVFQKPNPFPAMSIYDNVIAGLKLTGITADRDRRDYLVESSLTKAGLWKEVRDRLRAPGGGLSGGQQQRLCIARSLAVAPRVLLMDEPCSALDPTSTRVIEETMLELANEVTIVIVTHNMQQAQRVSTQCAFFLAAQGKPGGIVEHGSTEAMFGDPIDPRTFDYVNGRFG